MAQKKQIQEKRVAYVELTTYNETALNDLCERLHLDQAAIANKILYLWFTKAFTPETGKGDLVDALGELLSPDNNL